MSGPPSVAPNRAAEVASGLVALRRARRHVSWAGIAFVVLLAVSLLLPRSLFLTWTIWLLALPACLLLQMAFIMRAYHASCPHCGKPFCAREGEPGGNAFVPACRHCGLAVDGGNLAQIVYPGQ